MKETEICELCKKTEQEVVLIKYPFVSLFKGFGSEYENDQLDEFLCVECIKNDAVKYREWGVKKENI